jgi:hypothetical protein
MKTSFYGSWPCQKAAGLLVVIAFLVADAGLYGRPLRAQSAGNCRVLERKIAEAIIDNTPPIGTNAAFVYMRAPRKICFCRGLTAMKKPP